MIDIHSHFLPYIDDGAKTAEEAVRMLKMAASDGVRNVVFTPHLYVEAYKTNTPEAIIKAYESFLKTLGEQYGDLPSEDLPEVFLGSENFVNDRLIFDLENGNPVVTLNRTHYILLEFSLSGLFNFFDRLMHALFARGLTPIVAHPERNLQFQRDPQLLRKLLGQGALVQIDSMSLTGGFGAEAKKSVFYLLENDLAHFIGSDAHSVNNRKPILSKAVEIAAKLVGPQKAQALVTTNPSCVLMGEELPAQEEATTRTKRLSWLQSLFG